MWSPDTSRIPGPQHHSCSRTHSASRRPEISRRCEQQKGYHESPSLECCSEDEERMHLLGRLAGSLHLRANRARTDPGRSEHPVCASGCAPTPRAPLSWLPKGVGGVALWRAPGSEQDPMAVVRGRLAAPRSLTRNALASRPNRVAGDRGCSEHGVALDFQFDSTTDGPGGPALAYSAAAVRLPSPTRSRSRHRQRSWRSSFRLRSFFLLPVDQG